MKKTIITALVLFSFLTGCKKNETNNDDAIDHKAELKTEETKTPEAFASLKGEWQYEYSTNDDELPEMLFTLSILNTENGQFEAQYCAVAQKGKKIDCSSNKEINVQGGYKADKVLASFYSFSDSKKTKGEVELEVINKDSIRWTIKKGASFEFYAPTSCILTRVTKTESEDCKDIEVEMGSGRECILKNTDLAKAYSDIIKNKEVEESNYFLSAIPKENKSVSVNKNGLISIDYTITKNKVAISMNYEGGVTEVTLQKIDTTIKKSIYHYAD
ncbi:hypothetical protein [Flavobacterium reichenbachii]|uniref:hypothetical protein n=1 Tax=Flavobacterium reichenbachii TaxID=362418 RepID=UPI000AB2D947|nr:hypothetical protein [Flavobacterium reichenbachii]